MGFYDEEETALQYIAMAEGFDGGELVEVLRTHLAEGANVLENRGQHPIHRRRGV